LNDRRCLRGLVLVMDIRHPLTEFDQTMVQWCQHNTMPLMILATKSDKLKFGQAKSAMLGIRQKLNEFSCVQHLIMFSSSNKTGLDECREALTQWLEAEPDATAE